MLIEYTCYNNSDSSQNKWEGHLVPLKLTNPYEAKVSARGSSFHMVVGAYRHGNYICIPNWNIGSELAALTDQFWNYERLTCNTDLSETDASTIVYALSELNKLIN